MTMGRGVGGVGMGMGMCSSRLFGMDCGVGVGVGGAQNGSWCTSFVSAGGSMMIVGSEGIWSVEVGVVGREMIALSLS